jgi:hypothetical protein
MSNENFTSARGDKGSLGDLPLEVLTADYWVTGKQTPMKKAIVPLREEQAALSSRGRHLIVSGCDHTDMPIVQADAIADAVRHVLEIWRRNASSHASLTRISLDKDGSNA